MGPNERFRNHRPASSNRKSQFPEISSIGFFDESKKVVTTDPFTVANDAESSPEEFRLA